MMKRRSSENIQPAPPAGLSLAERFFRRDPLTCARELVGCELIWKGSAGLIVETEAYLADGDEACHTFHRPSARVFVATHPAGTAYVYLNYGVHWLLNFLVKEGSANGFVLIRALEPVRGVARMRQRRGNLPVADLCSGPGKLTRAMGIDGSLHGAPLSARGAPRLVWRAAAKAPLSGRRIGISRAVDLPWRFVLPGSPCLSAPA